MSRGLPARRIAPLVLIPGTIFLAYWSLRLAWADHLSRSAEEQTVARAVAWAPADASLRLRLADLRQASGGDFVPSLEAAAALEPECADIRLRLGAAAEMRGDLGTAESSLLEAARLSRQFAPRWALANFYFRRGDAPRFWRWARESASTGYADLRPLFQLCWRMSQDPDVIFDRAVPPTHDALYHYLSFLLEQRRMQASEEPARRLAAIAGPGDRPLLLNWCTRQLESGSIPAAAAIWDKLCRRHLLPSPPMSGTTLLTDPDFAGPFGEAFGWRLPAAPGISTGFNPAPLSLWIHFSGHQPETCSVLEQWVPVAPGDRYRFRFDYRTTDLASASGVRWTASDARSPLLPAVVSPWLSSEAWKNEELRFQAPPSGLARLMLLYQRQAGATRIEGTVEVRGVALERIP